MKAIDKYLNKQVGDTIVLSNLKTQIDNNVVELKIPITHVAVYNPTDHSFAMTAYTVKHNGHTLVITIWQEGQDYSLYLYNPIDDVQNKLKGSFFDYDNSTRVRIEDDIYGSSECPHSNITYKSADATVSDMELAKYTNVDKDSTYPHLLVMTAYNRSLESTYVWKGMQLNTYELEIFNNQ